MRPTLFVTTSVLALLHSAAVAQTANSPPEAVPVGATRQPIPPIEPLENVPVDATTMTPPYTPGATEATDAPAGGTDTPTPPVVPSAAATVPSLPTTTIPTIIRAGPRESSTVTDANAPFFLKNSAATSAPPVSPLSPTPVDNAGTKNSKNATVTPSPSSKSSKTTQDDDTTNSLMGADAVDSDPPTYPCNCSDVRKVSLMSASDYCLVPDAVIANKCGNPEVAEKGECPRAGALPCQDTGHVLTNSSMCAYDKRDDTYKCVASTEDLYIQKNGKRKKPSSSNATSKPPTIASDATKATGPKAVQVIMVVASVVLGLVTLS